MLRTSILAGLALVASSLVAAADIAVEDAYARAASPMAQSGAIFMAVTNRSGMDDTIIGAETGAAQRVELHTHLEQDDGIMRMVEIEEGIPIAAGATHLLQRGGDHVMLMGLTGPLAQGEAIELTLIFDHAEPVTVTVPVDNERMPDHGEMGHGDMRMDGN